MLSTTFFGTSNILAKNNISDQSTVLKIIFPSRVKLANCRILKTLSVSSKTFRNFSQNS